MKKVTEIHLDVKALDRMDVLLAITSEATDRLNQLATLFRAIAKSPNDAEKLSAIGAYMADDFANSLDAAREDAEIAMAIPPPEDRAAA